MSNSQELHPQVNFSELAEYLIPFLQQIGMNSSLAEAHGLFTGILCVNSSQTQESNHFIWFNLLDLEIDDRNVLAVEAKNEVDVFFQSVLQQLTSEDLDFQLGISDDESINDRVEDFSVWIQSFLYGLGLNEDALLDKGSQEVQDFIKDVIEISHAEDYQLSDSEEDESALFELVEYVRMGVLLVFQEFSMANNMPKQDSQSKDNLGDETHHSSDPLGKTLFH